MYKGLARSSSVVFFACCVLSILFYSSAKAADSVTYQISAVQTQLSDNTLTYIISGSTPPAYTVSERFSPFRAVVDIAGGVFAANVSNSTAQVPDNNFVSLKILDLKKQEPPVLRFEFSLADSHDYTVTNDGNSLTVSVFPATGKQTVKTEPLANSLTDFKITSTPNTTTITLVSNAAIQDYRVDTIGGSENRPPRMYIDIDNVNINELVREKIIGTSVEKIRVAPRGKGARIVFDSASPAMFKYSVAPTQEGLAVVIDESTTAGSPIPESKKASAVSASDSTLDALIGSSEELLKQDPDQLVKEAAQKNSPKQLSDDFSFSGYKKQRISVDFYKIDIHNVFRLFRQITDLNIIVDEDVSGSLTLALSDVPWDFALDIILNLMDLTKEEKFNTIVIYPKSKEFVWPTRADDNLAFTADTDLIQQEALVIEQAERVSPKIIEAKKLIGQAQQFEKNEDFETAAQLYTKAMELWPDNAKLANRLTTLYLVNLGMNAKAVYYAKENLKRHPKDNYAALYAAIGLANMQRISEAADYFAQSISSTPPMKEALLSYAAFSENNGQNDAALKLIDKYHTIYGESVDTMISKARILDKLGLKSEAVKEYKAILASGYQIRPDLKKYIQGRLMIQ